MSLEINKIRRKKSKRMSLNLKVMIIIHSEEAVISKLLNKEEDVRYPKLTNKYLNTKMPTIQLSALP